MNKYTVGQELFVAYQGYREPVRVDRVFVLSVHADGSSLHRVGDSKDPRSWNSSFPAGSDTSHYYATARDAVIAYARRRHEQIVAELVKLDAQADVLRDEATKLRGLDPDKVPVKSYPEDWTPCEL